MRLWKGGGQCQAQGHIHSRLLQPLLAFPHRFSSVWLFSFPFLCTWEIKTFFFVMSFLWLLASFSFPPSSLPLPLNASLSGGLPLRSPRCFICCTYHLLGTIHTESQNRISYIRSHRNISKRVLNISITLWLLAITTRCDGKHHTCLLHPAMQNRLWASTNHHPTPIHCWQKSLFYWCHSTDSITHEVSPDSSEKSKLQHQKDVG